MGAGAAGAADDSDDLSRNTATFARGFALNREMRVWAAGLAAWISLAPALLAAGPARELRFCLPGDPKTFDTLQVSEQNSEVVRYLTGGVLARVNRVTDEVQPELAESWKLTDGGRA